MSIAIPWLLMPLEVGVNRHGLIFCLHNPSISLIEFSRRPMDTVTVEGGMACLYCDYPSVEDIVWHRGSTSIEANDMQSDVCNCVASPGPPIRLCFPSVQRDDADRYTCHALSTGNERICGARLLLAGE